MNICIFQISVESIIKANSESFIQQGINVVSHELMAIKEDINI